MAKVVDGIGGSGGGFQSGVGGIAEVVADDVEEEEEEENGVLLLLLGGNGGGRVGACKSNGYSTRESRRTDTDTDSTFGEGEVVFEERRRLLLTRVGSFCALMMIDEVPSS